MADIALRGELWDNDSADVLRWWGFRDIVAPMDIQAALEQAAGEDVTVLVNSPGGDMTVGGEPWPCPPAPSSRASQGRCCAITTRGPGPRGISGI